MDRNTKILLLLAGINLALMALLGLQMRQAMKLDQQVATQLTQLQHQLSLATTKTTALTSPAASSPHDETAAVLAQIMASVRADVRQIMVEEVNRAQHASLPAAEHVAQSNRSNGASNTPQVQQLQTQLEQQLYAAASAGTISPDELNQFQTQVAQLPQDQQRPLLDKLGQEINGGRVSLRPVESP